MASSNQVSTPAESKPQMGKVFWCSYQTVATCFKLFSPDSCSGPITAAVVPVIIILIVLLIVISVAIVLLYAFKHRRELLINTAGRATTLQIVGSVLVEGPYC